tara:strand:- start:3330 stop:4202 length:873 start_codon:yes stop_codon:yes gene_type:complete
MSNELEDIKKQLEGNTLAMGAVAEVLQKMDERLSKAEEAEEEENEKAMEKAAHEELAKSITSMVLSNLKKEDPDNKLGLDTDGSKGRPAKATAPGPQDTDKPVSPTTDIEEQQNYIQASEDSLIKEEGDDEEEKMENMKMKAMDEDDKKEAMKADKDDEDMNKMHHKAEGEDKEDSEKMAHKGEDSDEMENMKKEIESLKKQLEGAVQTETEARLRKMGFREENGLQRPQVFTPDTPSALGTDGSTPIVKSQNSGDTVDQLSGLSYKQLRDIQHKIESGDTDGVPRELLG